MHPNARLTGHLRVPAGSRGSILLERTAGSIEATGGGEAAPLDEVLAELWREVDARQSPPEPGCTTASGAEIGCAAVC